MEKELHIWMGINYRKHIKLEDMFITLEETERALNENKECIHTTQPHVCSTRWIVKGYRVFVHMLNNEVVEMKLGYINENMKEIRVAHNLEKMLLSGLFGQAIIE